MSIAALPRGVGGEDGGFKSRIGFDAVVVARGVAADYADTCSSSSSIGKASESSSAVGSGARCQDEADEVQSSYKEPLCALHALEESLPVRRGISRFYNGKSKSFINIRASLSPLDSCKDLAKADNPYARKRKNMLAFNLMYRQPSHENLTRSHGHSSLSSSDSESIDGTLDTPSKRIKNPISIFSLDESFSMPSRSISMGDLQLASGPHSPPREKGMNKTFCN